MSKQTKYIFVTGGVLSGLGKGISAASIGRLLKARGFSVNIQKCDQYLNVDAGTLNPAEHGECFVTKDGAETDLDLGHYERFLDHELTQKSSLMTGRVLRTVIDGERAGKYLGKTVQLIPHVTDVVQQEIIDCGKGYDVHIVEIGGTVGDYEGLHFLEAIRELSHNIGRQNCLFVHVVYLPYLGASKEFKTKPAQNAVKDLRNLGIVPDILLARSETPALEEHRQKLSRFAGVPLEAIALLPNAQTIYQVPLTLEDAGIGRVIENRLSLPKRPVRLDGWRQMVERITKNHDKKIKIGVVAKYLNSQDTYMSIFEALKSAAWWQDTDVDISWIDAEKLTTDNVSEMLEGLSGIVVPGGFGPRGIEGKIVAAAYAKEQDLPFLGLCLGLQVAVIAAARLAGLVNANSLEFAPDTDSPVINTMSSQKGQEGTGGTMRLGNYECKLLAGSLASKLYGKTSIVERHRHRYEVNRAYLKDLQGWGLLASGISPDGKLVEMIEITANKFFVASQFHPEFNSRPFRPHPLFSGFILAACNYKQNTVA